MRPVAGRAGAVRPRLTRAARRLVVLAALGILLALGPMQAEATPDVRKEIQCLAQTIYFEARGEPTLGKLAVGHVVMNRVSHPRFPDGVCDVVRQGGEAVRYRCQFTWWCDGRSDEPANADLWEVSRALARSVYWDASPDPTAGALWYHANYVKPAWQRKVAPGPRIGRHIFYHAKAGPEASDVQLARSPD